MSVPTNPPPLKIPRVADPQLQNYFRQLSQFAYLLWDRVGGGLGIIDVVYGGTGADNAGDARTNLGLVIGSDVQAQDAGLQSISELSTSANQMLYLSGSGTYQVTSLTAFGRSLLDDANASAAQSTLGMKSLTDGSDADALHTHGEFEEVRRYAWL